MDKIIVETIVKHEFTPSDINDLIVGALEGGINYWCRKAAIKKDTEGNYFNVLPEDQDKVIYASDVIGYNGVLVLFDIESNDRWELTLENVLKGIKIQCEKRHVAPADLMDDYDADDCDCIVQFALFNEVQFG